MPDTIFVGRQEFIQQFRQMLHSPKGSPYIMNLRGEGGSGKSKILQRFAEICEEEDIPNTGILDFYSAELNSRISALEQEVADTLQPKRTEGTFAAYWRLRDHYRENRTHIRGRQLKRQFQIGLTEWSNATASRNKKGVFLFDTFEAVKDNLVGSRILNDWLPILQNCIVIFSGRQEENELEFMPEMSHLVIDAPLQTFSKEEAFDYFRIRNVMNAITADGVENTLYELTGGRPLLVALSADWIIENVNSDITPKALVEGIAQADFEHELVKDLPDVIRHPQNVILPYMAHILRPFDQELLQYLSPPNINLSEAEKILDNLSKLSFVKANEEGDKTYYWFQDELRALFQRYIFAQDITGSYAKLREHLSHRMIEFYDERIDRARERNDLRAERRHRVNRLYHEIFLADSPPQEIFTRARSAYETDEVTAIVHIFRWLVDPLDEEQVYNFNLSEARYLNDIGKANLARRKLLELLDDYGDDPERCVYIYNALARSYEKLGEFADALKYYGKSYTLSEELGLTNRLAREEINRGRVLQAVGNLDDALNHLNHALQLAQTYSLPEQIAYAMLELGYLYGLRGQHQEGIENCSEAVQFYESLSLMSRAAGGRVRRATICRNAGRYEEAVADIIAAIDIFDNSDYANLAEAYFHLGFTYWFQADNLNNDFEMLYKAREALETSISMAQEYKLTVTSLQALHQISHVYWLLGEKELARDTNEEAYELSVSVHDVMYSIDSLLAKAEFDFAEGLLENIPEYAKQIEEFEKDYSFPLFFGRLRRMLGEMALNSSDYEGGSRYYAEGLAMIAQHGGYAMYSIDRELEKLQVKLQSMTTQEAIAFCKNLKTYWGDEESFKLTNWADRCISRFTFQLSK